MLNNNEITLHEGEHICEECGAIYNESEMREVNGKWYCTDCFDDKFTTCVYCGEIIEQDDARYDPDGEPCCDDCFDERCFICEHCGEVCWQDDRNTVYTQNGRYGWNFEDWCDSCRDRHATQCDRCGEWYSDDDEQCQHLDGVDLNICSDCIDNYTRCSQCGEWVESDDAYYDDYGDPYCESCYDDLGDNGCEILSYHDYPRDHFWYRLNRPAEDDRHKFLQFGIELELCEGGENSANAAEIKDAFNMHNKYDVVCMRDGSLDDGFEIISQPATLQYHLKDFGWQKAMKAAQGLGYVSHNGGKAGLHVHVDRQYFNGAFENPEVAFIILTQNNLDWLKKFSRRKNWGYCQFQNVEGVTFTPDNFKDSDENSSLEYIERVRGYNHGHHVAMNYDGYSTIEFRFFRGTLKFQTFAASLQLVEMMCYAAKHLRKEQLCNVDLKWFKCFAKRKNYAEFNAYLAERGIMQ